MTTTKTQSAALDSLLLVNEALGEKRDKIFASVMAHGRDVDRSESNEIFARYEQINSVLHANVLEILGHGPGYGTMIMVPSGCDLRVADYHGGDTWVLTSDGLPVQPKSWHKGVETEAVVRYERWTLLGMAAHGYCDPVSRNLVQSG